MQATHSKSKKTVTQTFRIDHDVQETLSSEAKNQRVSLNTLVSNVLNDYAFYGRVAERYRALRLSATTIGAFLEVISDEDMGRAGSKTGHKHPAELLSALGVAVTVDNLVKALEEIYLRHLRWFDHCMVIKRNTWEIHLKHGFGQKWSIWLSEYFSSMFEEAGFRRMEPTVVDRTYTTLHFQPLPPYAGNFSGVARRVPPMARQGTETLSERLSD
jgi:HicB family